LVVKRSVSNNCSYRSGSEQSHRTEAVITISAATWIDSPQIAPQQAEQMAAILAPAEPGRTLGTTLLLPSEVRSHRGFTAIENGNTLLSMVSERPADGSSH